MSHSICVHTNDKLYVQTQIEKPEISNHSWNTPITHLTKPNSNALNNRI